VPMLTEVAGLLLVIGGVALHKERDVILTVASQN
jgi:hypothetical protein